MSVYFFVFIKYMLELNSVVNKEIMKSTKLDIFWLIIKDKNIRDRMDSNKVVFSTLSNISDKIY